MIAKIVLLFLAFMAILGLFGKWRLPGSKAIADKRCPSCGRFRLGKGPCDCGKGKG